MAHGFFMFVISFLFCCCYFSHCQALQKYVTVGCFRDTKDRALPDLIANFRNNQPIVDWNNLRTTVIECARVAESKGMIYFGLQFYGECWSGSNAHMTYDKYNTSTDCISGVGKSWTNYVYRLTGVEDECFAPSPFKSANRAMSWTSSTDECDKNLVNGWYRFLPPAGTAMPTSCVPTSSCGTVVTGWLKPRSQPLAPLQGIVDGTVCMHWRGDCCKISSTIKYRNCGRFLVYKLAPLPYCPLRYCGNM